jgi:hypothetical protein
MRFKKKPILRSSLEDKVCADLKERSVSFQYEGLKLKYQKKPSTYTPDIILPNGIIIEIKGYFTADDRAKHLLVREQHPHLDLRFLFQNAKKKIHKSSDTTYASWCDKYGFMYAEGIIPDNWLEGIDNIKERTILETKPVKRKPKSRKEGSL